MPDRRLARCLILSAVLHLVGLAVACRAEGLSSRPGPDYPRPPDRRGEAIAGDSYAGTRARVVLTYRRKNEGGSDGAGLCVIASLDSNGHYQGIGEHTRRLWDEAKRRPGGYSPSKLERLIQQVAPRLKYASYYGPDSGVLNRLSKAGYPIGATMNTGRQYGYRPIAHMVSLVHYDESADLAAVVDNNFPEVTSWMPAREFDRRWRDHGNGWAWVWDYPPPVVAVVALVAYLLPVAILAWFAGCAAVVRRVRGA